MGLLYGGGMRTLRQILNGCKKHHYVFNKSRVLAGRIGCDEYFCTNCLHIIHTNKRPLSLREKIPNNLYGYQPKDNGHMWAVGKPPVKP